MAQVVSQHHLSMNLDLSNPIMYLSIIQLGAFPGFIAMRCNLMFQTVVVCHPCCDIAAATEEKFWHVAHRLRLALSGSQVVAGGSESLVATRLYHITRE